MLYAVALLCVYRAMLRRAQYCYGKSSVRLSVTLKYRDHIGWNASFCDICERICGHQVKYLGKAGDPLQRGRCSVCQFSPNLGEDMPLWGWELVLLDIRKFLQVIIKPLDICYDFAAVLNLVFDYHLFGKGVPIGGRQWYCSVGWWCVPTDRLLYLILFGRNLRCKFWLSVVSPQFGEGVVKGVDDGVPEYPGGYFL